MNYEGGDLCVLDPADQPFHSEAACYSYSSLGTELVEGSRPNEFVFLPSTSVSFVSRLSRKEICSLMVSQRSLKLCVHSETRAVLNRRLKLRP